MLGGYRRATGPLEVERSSPKLGGIHPLDRLRSTKLAGSPSDQAFIRRAES
jgi:hypothetical protein